MPYGVGNATFVWLGLIRPAQPNQPFAEYEAVLAVLFESQPWPNRHGLFAKMECGLTKVSPIVSAIELSGFFSPGMVKKKHLFGSKLLRFCENKGFIRGAGLAWALLYLLCSRLLWWGAVGNEMVFGEIVKAACS